MRPEQLNNVIPFPSERLGAEPLASLAHELRTPLTSISNAVALLERALPPAAGDEARHLVGMIGRESKRSARLVSEVLASTRPRPPRPVPTDLNQLVAEAVTVARAGRPDADRVVVEVAFERGLPPARVDPDQLKQVLLNLVTNGLDACLAAPPRAAPRLTIRPANSPAIEMARILGQKGFDVDGLAHSQESLVKGADRSEVINPSQPSPEDRESGKYET